jgi:hypothetical protein
VFRLRVPALAGPQQNVATVAASLGASVRLAARRPRLRLVLALLTAEAIVVGALDLLFVILAVTVLGRPQAWAGYLNSAYGVGAVLAAAVSVLLVGRRLGGPILGAALPPFAELPAPELERLASALIPVEVPAGTALIRPGEARDARYAIAAGQLDVIQDGRFIRRCERGEVVPGTASVIARTDATVYKLDALAREP